MSFKKVLAILLAVCLLIPMAACGKNPDGDGTTTTTAQQAEVTDGSGEADPTEGEEADPTEGEEADPTEGEEADPTEGEEADPTEGEEADPTEGEEADPTEGDGKKTTTTKEDGKKTTTTKVDGKKTTTTKEDGKKTTTTKEDGKKTTTTKEDGKKTTTTTKDDGKKTTTTKNDTTTATKKPSRTSTKITATTTSRPNISGYVGGEVELKKGTTRVDKGVDFGGKTFLHASGGTGAASAFTQEGYDIFKEKYNGILKMDGLGHTDFAQKVAANQAAGKVYDVIFMNASSYPAMFVADCAVPVTEYLTTADLWKNVKEGGLSETVIQDFSWNGEAYSMGGNYMQVPYVVFYNKKIFEDNRMDDPETLIAKGQWTWEKYLELGKEYVAANPGKYFMHKIASYTPGGFFASYNTDIVVMKSGVVKENTSDKQLYKALDMLQKMHYGAGAIVDPAAPDNNSVQNAFINGTIATMLNSSGYWDRLAERAKSSSVFGKSVNNLGMVIAPRGEGSNNYGLMDNQWYVAGKGTSDPRVAICYAMMESTHNTLNVYSENTPAKYRDALCKIMDGTSLKSPLGTFNSSLGSLPRLTMIAEVCGGKNVSTVLTTYKKQIQRVVDAACK